MKPTLATLALLLLACACRAPTEPKITARPTPRADTDLPDPTLTPGEARDNVTKVDICAPGFTKTIRDVPAALKREVYNAHHRNKSDGVCCEIDHLIPLELGGSNRARNLWPQMYTGEWNARTKDRLENRLHRLVCADELDLTVAQTAIRTDWIGAYRKYIPPEPIRERRRRRHRS